MNDYFWGCVDTLFHRYPEIVWRKWRELKWFFKSSKKRIAWFEKWAHGWLAYDYVLSDHVSMMYEGVFYIVNLKNFYIYGIYTGLAPLINLYHYSKELRSH